MLWHDTWAAAQREQTLLQVMQFSHTWMHITHVKHVFQRHKQFWHNPTHPACKITMFCHDTWAPTQRVQTLWADNGIFTQPVGMSPMQNMFLKNIKNFHTTQHIQAVRLQCFVMIHEHVHKGGRLYWQIMLFSHPKWACHPCKTCFWKT